MKRLNVWQEVIHLYNDNDNNRQYMKIINPGDRAAFSTKVNGKGREADNKKSDDDGDKDNPKQNNSSNNRKDIICFKCGEAGRPYR